MNHTPEALKLANQLEANYAHVYAGLAPAAAAALRSQHARIADLEAQLYAVGAGGVGQGIKPQVQADAAQKPVAWICAEWSGSGVPELSFDGPPQELSVRDELTRPVWTPLYAAPQPARQPLTYSQVKELAKKHPAEDLCRWSYGMGIKDAEAAHGITGGQP